MKNYYDILEVSEKASQEVIDKAYKALAKKYHPDLQPQDKKMEAEETLKEINEAYSVLSDSLKKSDFDRQLNMQKEKEYWQNHKPSSVASNANTSAWNNSTSTSKSNPVSNSKATTNSSSINSDKKRIRKPKVANAATVNQTNNLDEEQYNDAVYKAYNDAYTNAYQKAYVDNLKSMGYKIRYKRTFKENLKLFFSSVFAILVLIIVIRVLLLIPATKEYFVNMYNDNELIKMFVDIIVRFFNNIIAIFKK